MEDLTTVEGIGAKTAAKIATAIQELSSRPAPEVGPSTDSPEAELLKEEAVEPEVV